MKASVFWLSLVLFAAAATIAAKSVFPEILPLPNGFRPEGIAIGRGTDFYVGSLQDGAIYRGSVVDGSGSVWAPGGEGRVTVGLAFDRRTGYLFAAGGPTGMARVFDTASGAEVGTYTLTGPGAFINDVIVTARAAYFTDSTAARLFVVPLTASGGLPEPSAVYSLALTGEWEQIPNAFNANGIEAPKNGKALIVVNSTAGALFRVDPKSGIARKIDLGGASVSNGDGLLLLGKHLYVVRNRLNRVAVVRLRPNLLAGEVVAEVENANFDVPTTLAVHGSRLYAVNARFTTTPGPDVKYWVTGFKRVPVKP